jgi:hypothetical protein
MIVVLGDAARDLVGLATLLDANETRQQTEDKEYSRYS